MDEKLIDVGTEDDYTEANAPEDLSDYGDFNTHDD